MRFDSPLFTEVSLKKSLSYTIPSHFSQDQGSLIPELGQFLSNERIDKMKQVVQKRSRKVLTVFENTHHGHNISAILRNVDTFGFLDLFFLYSNQNIKFRIADTIDRGSSQWLFPKRLTSIHQCAQLLKDSNYKIALVSLPDFSRTASNYQNQLPSFASTQFQESAFINLVGENPVALVFGSELIGVSKEWSNYADMYVHVDMFGFTESLNVSVCAGIILQSLRTSLEKYQNNFLISSSEEQLIYEHWIAKDYTKARQYISNRHPSLLNWFEFVRSGNFFSIDSDIQ